MVETLKVNLGKTALVLKIAGIVFGALMACAMTYGQLDARIDDNKLNQAVAEAVLKTKLEAIDSKVNLIYDIVKKQDE